MGVRVVFLPDCPLVKVIFLLDCPLILSLLKHRDVRAFFNKKMRIPNKRSPLNSSVYIYIYRQSLEKVQLEF